MMASRSIRDWAVLKVDLLQTIKLRHILLLAFVLRAAWALAVPIVPISDSIVYDMLAQRIAAGEGYSWPDGRPTVYWAVGAPALYGLVYAVFTQSFVAVAVVNVAMGTLLVAGVHGLALTRFDEGAARLAALLAAVWPAWIAITTVLNSELPSNLFMVFAMAMIMSRRYSLLPRVVVGGLLLVVAAYIRPITLPLIVAVPVLDAVVSRQWRAAVVSGVLSLAIAAAALAPWAMRNDAIFGQPVLVSANFGVVLWMGNNPASHGGYMELPADVPENEVERDALLMQRGLEYIKDNPGRYLENSLRRTWASYARESIAVAWNAESLAVGVQQPLKLVMAIYWLTVLGLSLAGFALFIRREPIRMLDPTTAAIGLLGSVSILVIGSDRYHFGMMPFVSTLAAYAIQQLVYRHRIGTLDAPAR